MPAIIAKVYTFSQLSEPIRAYKSIRIQSLFVAHAQHPWLGAPEIDMTYEISKAMNTIVTYGWLIVQITSGGPAEEADLHGGTRTVRVAGETVTVEETS